MCTSLFFFVGYESNWLKAFRERSEEEEEEESKIKKEKEERRKEERGEDVHVAMFYFLKGDTWEKTFRLLLSIPLCLVQSQV